MQKIIYLLAGAGLLFWTFGRKAKAIKDLNFDFSGLKFTGKTISDFKIYLQLEVTNQNSSAVFFKNIFLSIYDEKNMLGKVSYTDQINIPANNTTIINIPVRLNYGGLVYLVYEIIAKRRNPDFNVAGTMDTPLGKVSISKTIKFI
jgi:LEA14-like dessication related protein